MKYVFRLSQDHVLAAYERSVLREQVRSHTTLPLYDIRIAHNTLVFKFDGSLTEDIGFKSDYDFECNVRNWVNWTRVQLAIRPMEVYENSWVHPRDIHKRPEPLYRWDPYKDDPEKVPDDGPVSIFD